MASIAKIKHSSYDSPTIILHWLTASLFALLWIIGQTADCLPDGPANTAVWSLHVVLGFLLVGVLILRVIWRVGAGRRLPAADSGAMRIAAASTHYLLYALLGLVVALGIVNAFVRGYNLFDLVSLPQFGDKEMRHEITEWHGLAANITLGLIGFHALAALAHHYVWRDGVLARMLPGAPTTRARSTQL
jgi:cytochrome b561